MSLRTRLIIAFLALSIVPLSAVTLIWYVTSVRTFERVAQREATETAADIGRRMEMVTANLGRRMDRMFDEAVDSSRAGMTGPSVHARLAPLLGDSVALVEKLEFHPSAVPDPDPNPNPSLNPNPDPNPVPERHVRAAPGRPPVPPPAGHFRGPRPPSPPPPPAAPPVIVVDIPKVVESAQLAAAAAAEAQAADRARAEVKDAQRAARARMNEAERAERRNQRAASPNSEQAQRMVEPGKVAGVDINAIVADALKSVPIADVAVKEAIAREAIAATAQKPEMAVSGQRIEMPVKKGGRIVGKANAMLNLDRTLHSVLSLARREQGEIPFAVDQQGRLYTPDVRGRDTLQRLGVASAAGSVAQEPAKRIGDWLVVARKDPGGLIFGIARPIGDSLREIRRLSLRNLSVGLFVIALACIGIVPISRRMTEHVSSLSDGVRQLAGGDFRARVPVRSKDEFGTLAASFNKMAEDLEHNQALVVEQERLRRELELSRQIQTEMLPRAPLRLGTAEIKGLSIPAREVGGDFFNYFALSDGRLALLVGDVSGKGVSAALLMANVQATLRARLPLETDLARLADGLDREIDENTPKSVYVTLFLGILDIERPMLRYVNAGHNPQFILRHCGGIEALSSTGMPVALYAGQGYQEAAVQIAAGDLLFFYTDGLVETENESGDMFGAERLQTLLAGEHEQRIDTVLERVDASVRSFRGKAEQFDDATMMALRIDV
jgi:serine phosphatase RsbU (regulator of sigma subunit)